MIIGFWKCFFGLWESENEKKKRMNWTHLKIHLKKTEKVRVSRNTAEYLTLTNSTSGGIESPAGATNGSSLSSGSASSTQMKGHENGK